MSSSVVWEDSDMVSNKQISKVGNKYRVHRMDEKKSEIQGMSFFETDGLMDVVDGHPKNVIVDSRKQIGWKKTAYKLLNPEDTASALRGSAQAKRSEQDNFIVSGPMVAIGQTNPHSKKEGRDFHPIQIARAVKGTFLGQQETFVVSGQMISTSMPARSTARTSETKNSSKQTYTQSTLIKSQTSSFSPLAFLARASALLGRGWDFKTLVARYSTRYSELQRLKDLRCFSWKTLEDYLATTEEKPSRPFFGNWGISGTGASGRYLTANILEFPRIGKGSSLSDILEETVDEKYFLSQEHMAWLTEKLKEKGNSLSTVSMHTTEKAQTSTGSGQW